LLNYLELCWSSRWSYPRANYTAVECCLHLSIDLPFQDHSLNWKHLSCSVFLVQDCGLEDKGISNTGNPEIHRLHATQGSMFCGQVVMSWRSLAETDEKGSKKAYLIFRLQTQRVGSQE
jgi:hypothetical protein